MKHKDGMAGLRRNMVITFIVSIIVVGIFDSIIDTVMDKLAPLVSDSPQKTVALAVGMFALNLAVYAVCGFVFFGITRKNIRNSIIAGSRKYNPNFKVRSYALSGDSSIMCL